MHAAPASALTILAPIRTDPHRTRVSLARAAASVSVSAQLQVSVSSRLAHSLAKCKVQHCIRQGSYSLIRRFHNRNISMC